MKILHVVNSLDPGGMENGVVNLARGLESRGFETHVACLERRGVFSGRLPASSKVLLLGKSGGFSPGAAWRLARAITQLRPDVIHSHNLGPLIYSGLATAGGRRCPWLQGEHSQLTAEERLPRRLRQRRWLYRGCHTIHTVSTAMREELVACGFPAQKIVAIANGVDTGRFAPGGRIAARAALGVPPDALCIGIVGRFGPFKRHRQLIEAFEQIVPRLPRARLLIAGGGGSEEAAVHQRVQASSFRPLIHLAGFQNEPRACYQAMDLLVVPSINEGLSNAALEAMACGVPALVRSGCGHEQIITHGHDGWIAGLDSSADLAGSLAEILAEPIRLVDFGRNARKKVTSHFSLESMITSYEHLYRASAPR
ncbi:MAG: glycosyltransferase [Chthoniobacter sp.]|uniref:glycosyltransferase n=1 Tax=Chthoniobacter sp. TaxID=2510640 RepID=UPI0032A82EA9